MSGGRDFQSVYDELQPRIRRYLGRLAGAREADDLTQETFVRVSQGLDHFRGESSLATWVYRIATNVALDRLRSASFQAMARAGSEALLTLGTPSMVEERVAGKEMSECVRGFVDQLPEAYRSVIVLSELEDLPDRQIAEVLGISVETVKIRLHRARTRLREMLERGCALSHDERNELSCEPKLPDVSSAD